MTPVLNGAVDSLRPNSIIIIATPTRMAVENHSRRSKIFAKLTKRARAKELTVLLLLVVLVLLLVYYWIGAVSLGKLSLQQQDSLQITTVNNLNRLGQTHGYLLTLHYAGQLVAGVKGLLSQQCWISSFNLPLAIVEPFIINSHLGHSLDLWHTFQNQTSVLRFSDAFDVSYFNGPSSESSQPTVKTWKEFLQTAPREIVLVTIRSPYRSECLLYKANRPTKWDGDHEFFSGCQNNPDKMTKVVNFLKENYGFDVVRTVCLNCEHDASGTSPDLVTKKILGPHNAKSVTIIINVWKYSMKLLKGNYYNCNIHNWQKLRRSPQLEKDANTYLTSFYGSQKVLAIMIRFEWYLITKTRISGDVGTCLKQVEEEIRKQNDKAPFVSIDVGTYGSSTYYSTLQHTHTKEAEYLGILNASKSFVEKLFSDRKWTFNDWEKSFLTIPGVSHNSGYIASLQKMVASKADCLILVGGGQFQETALQNYLELHPTVDEQCVKYICMSSNFHRAMTRIVKE